MKATIYTTNSYGEWIASPLPQGTSLGGITTVEESEAALGGFLGCGVAITGSSCYNLARMEPMERQKLLRFLYTEEGLNLKVGRLTIGSSDYSAEVYSYDDGEEDLALERFSVARDREYIIPMIKEILAVRPDLVLFASPWSPPGWMKTGGSMGGGYMRSAYVECYAEYIIKYLQAYEAEGIPVYAVTPQNEPETQQAGKMPACIWHPEIEAAFIKCLKKKLRERGMSTRIWCHDHNFEAAEYRVDWMLQNDPELAACCDGAAFHYYGGSVEHTAFLKEKYPDLELHFSEGGPRLFDHYDTDWCKWGLMVIRALRCGYRSFTGWNLMLDESGGPNVGPFFCGGLVTRNRADGSLGYSGQYKAFRHFSVLESACSLKPLVMHRIAADNLSKYPSDGYFTEGCAARTPDGKTVLFLVNPAKGKEQLQFSLAGRCYYIEMLPDTLATVVIEG